MSPRRAAVAALPASSTPEAVHRRDLLRTMLLIRSFEETCAELYSAARIRGFVHLYVGEEAVATGVMSALGPDDAVVSTYREHGHALARGLYQLQTLFGAIGPYRFATPFIRFSESPTSVRQPPVAFGEHNDYVYRELLGIDDAEFDRLVAAGHIAQDFDESIP